MKRSILRRFVAATVFAALIAPVAVPAAFAADKMPPAKSPVAAPPSNVLLFPPILPGVDEKASDSAKRNARDAQEIITEAIKTQLTKAGVGAYVYSLRMPSVQRAVSENLIKAENAKDPTSDDRLAARVADIVGAEEYVIADVSDFAYDEKSHTATFTLSLIRKATIDGMQLGTVAEKATGVAPDDVSPVRQQGSAVAHAAEVVAEQAVGTLFPMPKMPVKGKKKR